MVAATVLACLATAGCDDLPGGGGPPEFELEGGRVVTLPEGTELLDIRLTAAGRDAAFDPPQVSARPGDAIRFQTAAGGTHALAFAADSLSAPQRAFLEQSNQLRAPPLVEPGAAWVVSLEGAPEGIYPFRCITHGEHGRLTVSGRAER